MEGVWGTVLGSEQETEGSLEQSTEFTEEGERKGERVWYRERLSRATKSGIV